MGVGESREGERKYAGRRKEDNVLQASASQIKGPRSRRGTRHQCGAVLRAQKVPNKLAILVLDIWTEGSIIEMERTSPCR